jgi:hypothetical protein
MLYEIKLQLSMNSGVTNFYVHSEKIDKICRHLMINLCKRILTLLATNMPGSSLVVILDDHVMHDHTSLHHLPHLIVRPGKSRIPNNRKLSLKHTKCPLDIVLAALLTLRKVVILSTCWRGDYFHKYRSCWIDTIG